MQLNLPKCNFFTNSASFLGFILTKDGVMPDPSKTAALMDAKAPTNLHEVRSTIGMLTQYHRYIKHFSELAKPITDLTKGAERGKKFKKKIWTQECDVSFTALKKAIATNVVLSYPNFNEPFIIHCDSSDYSIGGCISQCINDMVRPISFYSKKLSSTELNYATIDREALAIYYTLDQARTWLLGFRIYLWSDHKPLQYIFRSSTSNQRLIRWKLFIMEFNPTIQYIKGSENVVADWLSRHGSSRGAEYRTTAMQDAFATAAHCSVLPQSVPDTFLPNIVETEFVNIDFKSHKFPIILLADCMSLQPKGILSIISQMFPYLKEMYNTREPAVKGLPYCS